MAGSPLAAIATAALLSLPMMGCASLPSLEGHADSQALTGTADTFLGRTVAAAGQSADAGIHPLRAPRDAFAARAALATAAERSLDVQYYIWRGDASGTLLFESLWRAAERGVRVRLLLDDINTAGLDDVLAALDAHARIEVRLYNPLVHRSFRPLDYLTDFSRVNRRMHNKSFTADNQATIVGGRNIGDEYFAAGDGTVFADLDVLAVGPVVREVSKSFDRYWNSASAYPVASLVEAPGPDAAAQLEAKFAAARAAPEAQAYLEALRETELVRQLAEHRLALEWAPAQVLQDDPAKTLERAKEDGGLLLPELLRHAGQPRASLDLVSPYFVPGEKGTESFGALAKSGVRVRVLTNSLAATDVAPVHAGYAKRRAELLRAGVRLYELKPTAGQDADVRALGGSRGASLHAKTFALDGRRLFVGSFNFDPRSAELNTELGLLIESPVLASQLVAAFDTLVPLAAYEVELDEAGNLQWIERTGSSEHRHDSEPGTGPLLRAWLAFLGWLPIEWML